MTKTFYYTVAGFEFVDTTAFGKAWKEAKIKATELHTYVARTVVQTGKENRYEVYLKGGCFLPAEMVTKDRYHIF